MREFGDALMRRRRDRADRHLLGRRASDSGHDDRHARCSHARGARRQSRVVAALEDVPAAVAGMVRAGDLVITLGAGSIGWHWRANPRSDTSPAHRIDGRQGGQVKVKAPSEKNFRRARAKPARRRGWRAIFSWRVVRASVVAAVLLLAGYRAFNLAYKSSLFRVNRVRVHGNVRISSGRGAGHRPRSPGCSHPDCRPDRVPRRGC